MKKTLKVLGLLAISAVLFMGCKKDAGDSKKDISGDLFSADELTVDASQLTLSDGSWTYREVEEEEDTKDALHVEFTVKNGTLDEQADIYVISSKSGTIPEGVSEEEIASQKKIGYSVDGNKYSYYREVSKKETEQKIAEKMQADPNWGTNIQQAARNGNLDDIDESDISLFADYMTVVEAIDEVERLSSRSLNWKTNEAQSKYYAIRERGDETIKYFLSKN